MCCHYQPDRAAPTEEKVGVPFIESLKRKNIKWSVNAILMGFPCRFVADPFYTCCLDNSQLNIALNKDKFNSPVVQGLIFYIVLGSSLSGKWLIGYMNMFHPLH
jgi:hypothetical protein